MKDAMSRNRYLDLKSLLHFNDNKKDEKHAISVRGKKWYWCLFTRMVTVINSLLAFNRYNENKSLSVKEFWRKIAGTYLKKSLESRSMRGRPTNQILSRTSNIPDIRYDQNFHEIQKRDKKRRCQFENCNGKSRTFCVKCDVTLCIGCFPKYHTKSWIFVLGGFLEVNGLFWVNVSYFLVNFNYITIILH